MKLSFQSITSKSNPKIVHAAKYADKKHREADGVFVCEGIKLFEEAVFSGSKIREIYVDETVIANFPEQTREALSLYSEAEIYLISHDLYRKISTEIAPQGIFTVIEKLHSVRYTSDIDPHIGETVMLFESIRDPGNLGTLIRTAAALGFDRLILSEDCTDVYNPKVIRASMGAVFKIQLDYHSDLVKEIKTLAAAGRRVFAAIPREKAFIAGKDALYLTDCIVIGNEGQGLSDRVIQACDRAVYIPMRENTESLNAAVASAILMWEIAKSNVV